MSKYEEALKQLVWFAREYDGKPEQVELLTVACKKAEAFDILKELLFTKDNNGIISIFSNCGKDKHYELQVTNDYTFYISEKQFNLLKEVLNDNR